MRAIWKGHIRFSLVTIPIRIYSAIDTKETISFNQLHKDDNGRVGYDKRCKKCGKVLNINEIVKGYEYEPDQYVIMEQEDFEKVKLTSTKIIEIEGFIDSSEVHPTLYEAPYFAGPDGDVAAKAYALLVKTLQESGKLGIGKVVIRDREDVVLLSPQENALILYKLRYPDEIRDIKEIPQLNGVTTDKDQLKLAKTFVDSMTIHLEDVDIKDRYKEAVREMLKAKIEGKEVITTTEEVKPVVDMMKALKESLERAKKQKMPMEKAKGREKKEKVIKAPAKKRKQAAH
jgi:DNA end-binding protein Ku